MKTIAVLCLAIVLAGCSGSPLQTAATVVATTPAVVQAPSAPPCGGFACGFTGSSVVKEKVPGIWYVGAEALVPAGFSSYEIPFQLPANGTVTSFHGKIAVRFGNCTGQSLAFISVDGVPHWLDISKGKIGGGGEALNTVVNIDVPLHYSEGKGVLHVESDPTCGAAADQTWEIQGLMRVTP